MRALRQALRTAGFTIDSLKRALGADDSLAIPPHQVPLLGQRLGDRPLATLIHLFVTGVPVTEQDARRALAPLDLAEAVAMGVVGLGRSRVHAALRITPAEHELVFASDLEGPELPVDYVMGVADSSRVLSRLTFRRPVERALDLGTGCGYHAILAARHAGHVIATDISPRAIAFTQFNALLNGASNVECRVGDRFQPVADEAFDLIVSNPPFVISPDRTTLYRDSGLGADRVSQLVMQESASHLRPGGTTHMLISWIHAPDSDWSAPLRAWVAGTGCDAWFIRHSSYDPLGYAALWNQRLAQTSMQRYSETVARWTTYCERLGIGALGYGAAMLRRRAADTYRVRADEAPPEGVTPDAAADLDRLMHVEDRLEELDDAALLDQLLSVVPGTRFEQVMDWRDGAFRTVEVKLFRDVGLRPRAELDTPIAVLLSQVDGKRTVAEVIERTAGALKVASPDTLRGECLYVIRQLMAHGFLDIVEA